MRDILFCHGLDSGPVGTKSIALRDSGLPLISPDFRYMNLLARVALLDGIIDQYPDAVVVGSSYGGITALCCAIGRAERGAAVTPMLLLAPALGVAEAPACDLELAAPVATRIIHGVRDKVVPIALSRELAARDPNVELTEVDDDHRLAGSLELIVRVATELARG